MKTLNKKKRSQWRKLKRRQVLRFDELKGKTVDFIELSADADFPCVEIAFDDKTALLVVLDARLTIGAAILRLEKGQPALAPAMAGRRVPVKSRSLTLCQSTSCRTRNPGVHEIPKYTKWVVPEIGIGIA